MLKDGEMQKKETLQLDVRASQSVGRAFYRASLYKAGVKRLFKGFMISPIFSDLLGQSQGGINK